MLAASQAAAGSGLPPGMAGAPAQQPLAAPQTPPATPHNDPQAAQAQQQPQQTQQTPQDPQQAQLAAFIGQIAYPLFTHLTADKPDGGDFADWMLTTYPPDVLVTAQQIDAAILKGVIMTNPDLWTQLAADGVDEPKLAKFIEEFRAYTGEDAPPEPK
jgi:hypothetical protein